MKQVFTIMLFLFVIQCGWSQVEMKLKPRFSFQNGDNLIPKRPLFPSNNFRSINPDSARFSHPVAAGSVYILLQDNIPCLKPDTNLVYDMPVQTAPGNGNMPNAYQQSQNELLQSLLKKQFQKDKK